MQKRTKILLIILAFIITLFVLIGSIIFNFINQIEMRSVYPFFNLYLKNENNNIEETFYLDSTNFIGKYEVQIAIILDISYYNNLNNYLSVEIYNDDIIIYSNNINILEPIEISSETITKEGNIINNKSYGIYGTVDLETGIKYKIKVKTYFDNNLLEIKSYKLRLEIRE